MAKINILPRELSLKIAAGEVIERPASIVKELLENALDAEANNIRLTLEGGGLGEIRVTDNGVGMEPEDATLAFERYATSKISRFDDLYRIASFGFRGEALPSIAAVARVELVTRTSRNTLGVRVIAEEGRVKEVSEAGCPVGTDITITDIFAGVPVRRKFLKSEGAEQALCLERVQQAALAAPSVRFEAVAGGRTLLTMPATERLAERLVLLFGRETYSSLVPLQGAVDGISLEGFITRPGTSRANTRHIYCYVNGRYVRDPLIQRALMAACRSVLEPRRYPMVILFIHLPQGDVDVNVHPAKMEVRFRDPATVYRLIVEAAAHALAGAGAAVTVSTETMERYLYPHRIQEAQNKFVYADKGGRYYGPVAGGSDMVPLASSAMKSEGEDPASMAYLGQVAGTYLVFAMADGLVIVDQHAAHERIVYERLRRAAGGAGVEVQTLLIPEMIELTPGDFALLSGCLDLLTKMGMETEVFGRRTVIVKTVPADIPDLDVRSLLQDIIDDLSRGEPTPSVADRRERIMVLMACKGAVKARRSLTPAEARNLCGELFRREYPPTCPHGRPLKVIVSMGELEKMFKRR